MLRPGGWGVKNKRQYQNHSVKDGRLLPAFVFMLILHADASALAARRWNLFSRVINISSNPGKNKHARIKSLVVMLRWSWSVEVRVEVLISTCCIKCQPGAGLRSHPAPRWQSHQSRNLSGCAH